MQMDIGAAFMDRRALLASVVPQARVSVDCLSCFQPIPASRLQAAPASSRCVPCQERHDRPGVTVWRC